MKKIYLSLIGGMLVSSLSAQITLTNANSTPAIGDSFTYISESTTMNVANSGTNQTWDFSGITGSTSSMTAITLANSLDPSTFPTATVVESYDNSEQYMLSSSTEYTQVGLYSPGQIRLTYSDPREFLKFPLSYQTVYNETFLGNLDNIAAGQTFSREGTVDIEADGYGDLILPYTTMNNTLRIKITAIYEDSY